MQELPWQSNVQGRLTLKRAAESVVTALTYTHGATEPCHEEGWKAAPPMAEQGGGTDKQGRTQAMSRSGGRGEGP